MVVNCDFDITVLDVVAANRLYNHAFETKISTTDRKRWAVALKSSGVTYYTVNGADILSDRFHPVILPKGSSYSWRCVEAGECLLIEFESDRQADELYSFFVPDSGFYIRDFVQIQRALSVHTAEGRMEAFSKLYDILRHLFKTDEKEYVPKEKMRLIQPAENYILEHYYDPGITNDQLAGLCGISTVYFRKCFESVHGISPIRYLNDYRTRRAKDILSSDFESIAQVAESVGYNSVYHFSKMFKVHTGISPTEYAKTSRK